jgi:hypothetical protein
MADELGWREAALKVLQARSEPMHYTAIAEAIAEQKLRPEIGANPANAVNVAITLSLNNDAETPFVRVARGVYALRNPPTEAVPPRAPEADEEEADETGLINAFGMYWARSFVLWTPAPRILGQQSPDSSPVDFFGQRGVYLLHDGRSVVYVGRTTDQTLGIRLRQHVNDRLNGRWDRFSWFGTYRVDESGSLVEPASSSYNQLTLIATMEALLIEGLEPPQNRKRGDDFRAIEYLQLEDPDIKKRNIIALMDELKLKL